MTASTVPDRVLHVANGSSTTRLITEALLPGAQSLWADPLYEGPVPDGVSDDALVAVRRSYLADVAPGAAADPVNDLRAWRAAIAAQDYAELVLWFEHDLFDQLNLVQLLAWLAERSIAARISLICVASMPGRATFRGLGELTPAEIAALYPRRQIVTAAQFALATEIWSAFRRPQPDGLDALRQSDTTALPFTGPAIARLLQELPWTIDGLSRTERHLLRLAAALTPLADVFQRLGDGEQVYYPTDLSTARMARELSQTVPPLLTLAPQGDAENAVVLTLTGFGDEVLAGRADRIAACGIDRWLGGVHLRPGHIWRWDDVNQRVAPE